MHFYIFTNVTAGKETKQKFVSSTKYYNAYSAPDIFKYLSVVQRLETVKIIIYSLRMFWHENDYN